jgi:hypothetical protein
MNLNQQLLDHFCIGMLKLVFDGRSFPVPKTSVTELWTQRQDLFEGKTYIIRSSVPLALFEAFVASLKSQKKMSVTKGNATSLGLLANECLLSGLATECATVSLLADLEQEIEAQKREFEDIRLELRKVISSVRDLGNSASPGAVPRRSLTRFEIPVDGDGKWCDRLKGILSHLTKKHGGNVHDQGIVRITSTSGAWEGLHAKFVADMDRLQWFCSTDEPVQWVCWDFLEMRVCPTHYTIGAFRLKSWVLEGSLDGANWREIDRKTNTQDFKGDQTVSFIVVTPMECRFIRLTQTDKNHCNEAELILAVVEFFGTLFG